MIVTEFLKTDEFKTKYPGSIESNVYRFKGSIILKNQGLNDIALVYVNEFVANKDNTILPGYVVEAGKSYLLNVDAIMSIYGNSDDLFIFGLTKEYKGLNLPFQDLTA